MLFLILTFLNIVSIVQANYLDMTRRSPRSITDFAHHLEGSELARSLAKKVVGLKQADNLVPLSQYLWDETSKYQSAALHSGYIQGLKKASLNPEGFGGYMVQDSVFCYQAKQNIDIAANRAQDPLIRTFLEARSKSYQSYYEDLFKTWHIDEPAGISLGQACRDYVNHEHNVATNMTSIYFIVALIPCAKLWPWLGSQIGAGKGSFGVYTDWVNSNLNPDASGVAKYETIINNAEAAGVLDRIEALKVYTASMQGEAGFFGSVKTVF